MANQQLVQLGLDDLGLELGQLKALPAAITHGNRVLTGREPIRHLGGAPDIRPTRNKPHSGLLAVFFGRQRPRFVVLLL
jgi:hypothetical protein